MSDETSKRSAPLRFLGNSTSTVIAKDLFPGANGMGEVEISTIFNGGGLYDRLFRFASIGDTNQAKAIIKMTIVQKPILLLLLIRVFPDAHKCQSNTLVSFDKAMP